jgi:hypothetical protein
MSSAMRRLTNSLTKSTTAFRRRLSALCLNIALAAALTACGALSVESDYPEGEKVATAESGSVFDFFTFGEKDPAPQASVQQAAAPAGGLSVNAVLWQASLETLSFMPLASADPIGGVIISDWYNDPAATNERVKVNLIISGLELRADALRASLFRETLRGGKWVATATSVAAARQLENIVLTRARDLAVSRRADR